MHITFYVERLLLYKDKPNSIKQKGREINHHGDDVHHWNDHGRQLGVNVHGPHPLDEGVVPLDQLAFHPVR